MSLFPDSSYLFRCTLIQRFTEFQLLNCSYNCRHWQVSLCIPLNTEFWNNGATLVMCQSSASTAWLRERPASSSSLPRVQRENTNQMCRFFTIHITYHFKNFFFCWWLNISYYVSTGGEKKKRKKKFSSKIP